MVNLNLEQLGIRLLLLLLRTRRHQKSNRTRIWSEEWIYKWELEVHLRLVVVQKHRSDRCGVDRIRIIQWFEKRLRVARWSSAGRLQSTNQWAFGKKRISKSRRMLRIKRRIYFRISRRIGKEVNRMVRRNPLRLSRLLIRWIILFGITIIRWLRLLWKRFWHLLRNILMSLASIFRYLLSLRVVLSRIILVRRSVSSLRRSLLHCLIRRASRCLRYSSF